MRRVERVARAICKFQGLPENTQYDGRPMWESFVIQALSVLEAVDQEPSGGEPEGEDAPKVFARAVDRA